MTRDGSTEETPTHTPRSRDEITSLLREEPPSWEYYLYAGSLFVARDKHIEAYQDHLLRFAPIGGEPLDESAAVAHLETAFSDATALCDGLMRCFDPHVHERAFGAPGEPGDLDLIQHLARRTIDAYRQFIDWAHRLRSARVPAEFRQAFNLGADLMHGPTEQIHSYVDEMAELMDPLVAEIAEDRSDEPIGITIELVLNIDSDANSLFTAEIDRLRGFGF